MLTGKARFLEGESTDRSNSFDELRTWYRRRSLAFKILVSDMCNFCRCDVGRWMTETGRHPPDDPLLPKTPDFRSAAWMANINR